MCRTAEQLKRSIDKLNAARDRRARTDPAARVERTLDAQLTALRGLDARAADAERALAAMGLPVQ